MIFCLFWDTAHKSAYLLDQDNKYCAFVVAWMLYRYICISVTNIVSMMMLICYFLFAQHNTESISRAAHENIIIALAPLLENNHPTQEICDFFSLVGLAFTYRFN